MICSFITLTIIVYISSTKYDNILNKNQMETIKENKNPINKEKENIELGF